MLMANTIIPRPQILPTLQCVRSCDQKPYLHNKTKGGICIKVEFNSQKNISVLQDGRRPFVYSFNMATMTSCEHTLLVNNELSTDQNVYSQVEFPPDLCSRVTFVNFTVTRSSLQSQCLNQVLKAERPDVDEKRSDLLKLQGKQSLLL